MEDARDSLLRNSQHADCDIDGCHSGNAEDSFCEMLRRIGRKVVSDVSKVGTAFIFRAKQS
jgi:hypothetical protein